MLDRIQWCNWVITHSRTANIKIFSLNYLSLPIGSKNVIIRMKYTVIFSHLKVNKVKTIVKENHKYQMIFSNTYSYAIHRSDNLHNNDVVGQIRYNKWIPSLLCIVNLIYIVVKPMIKVHVNVVMVTKTRVVHDSLKVIAIDRSKLYIPAVSTNRIHRNRNFSVNYD